MVSIIILSYNTPDLLKACLTSIYKHIKEEIEIIVVDNASSDDSVAMVKKEFKKVILIESKKNLGFSGGVNLGAKSAKGEFLLFLNSDTTLIKGELKNVLEIFDKDTSTGIIGGKQVDQHGKSRLSYGKMYSLVNIPFMGLDYLLFNPDAPLEKIKKVQWVNGACMFIKADLFKKLNGFDENFFMYMEDMELCYRVRKLGYKIILFNDFVVQHKEFGSSDRSFAISNIYKGILYFFKKHKNTVEYTLVKLLLIAKAYFAISVGFVLGKPALVSTYKKALQSI